MTDDQRFGGIRRLYGDAAYQVFTQAHVCVIGVGGVGSWAAEALARSGVGKITLIDMDDVCITNTNRQIHALEGNIGESKVDVMAERIKLINPNCQVTCIEDFITPDNIPDCLLRRLTTLLTALTALNQKPLSWHGVSEINVK